MKKKRPPPYSWSVPLSANVTISSYNYPKHARDKYIITRLLRARRVDPYQPGKTMAWKKKTTARNNKLSTARFLSCVEWPFPRLERNSFAECNLISKKKDFDRRNKNGENKKKKNPESLIRYRLLISTFDRVPGKRSTGEKKKKPVDKWLLAGCIEISGSLVNGSWVKENTFFLAR